MLYRKLQSGNFPVVCVPTRHQRLQQLMSDVRPYKNCPSVVFAVWLLARLKTTSPSRPWGPFLNVPVVLQFFVKLCTASAPGQ